MREQARPFAVRAAERHALLDAAARELVEVCRDLGDVDAVYVFGSYARGTVGLTSDLDVLIIRRTDLRQLDRDLDIRSRCRARVGMDFIVVTPREYRENLPTTAFGQTILREAVLLYAI